MFGIPKRTYTRKKRTKKNKSAAVKVKLSDNISNITNKNKDCNKGHNITEQPSTTSKSQYSLPSDYGADSFDKLLKERPLLREKNIIKKNINAKYNRDSFFENSFKGKKKLLTVPLNNGLTTKIPLLRKGNLTLSSTPMNKNDSRHRICDISTGSCNESICKISPIKLKDQPNRRKFFRAKDMYNTQKNNRLFEFSNTIPSITIEFYDENESQSQRSSNQQFEENAPENSVQQKYIKHKKINRRKRKKTNGRAIDTTIHTKRRSERLKKKNNSLKKLNVRTRGKSIYLNRDRDRTSNKENYTSNQKTENRRQFDLNTIENSSQTNENAVKKNEMLIKDKVVVKLKKNMNKPITKNNTNTKSSAYKSAWSNTLISKILNESFSKPKIKTSGKMNYEKAIKMNLIRKKLFDVEDVHTSSESSKQIKIIECFSSPSKTNSMIIPTFNKSGLNMLNDDCLQQRFSQLPKFISPNENSKTSDLLNNNSNIRKENLNSAIMNNSTKHTRSRSYNSADTNNYSSMTTGGNKFVQNMSVCHNNLDITNKSYSKTITKELENCRENILNFDSERIRSIPSTSFETSNKIQFLEAIYKDKNNGNILPNESPVISNLNSEIGNVKKKNLEKSFDSLNAGQSEEIILNSSNKRKILATPFSSSRIIPLSKFDVRKKPMIKLKRLQKPVESTKKNSYSTIVTEKLRNYSGNISYSNYKRIASIPSTSEGIISRTTHKMQSLEVIHKSKNKVNIQQKIIDTELEIFEINKSDRIQTRSKSKINTPKQIIVKKESSFLLNNVSLSLKECINKNKYNLRSNGSLEKGYNLRKKHSTTASENQNKINNISVHKNRHTLSSIKKGNQTKLKNKKNTKCYRNSSGLSQNRKSSPFKSHRKAKRGIKNKNQLIHNKNKKNLNETPSQITTNCCIKSNQCVHKLVNSIDQYSIQKEAERIKNASTANQSISLLSGSINLSSTNKSRRKLQSSSHNCYQILNKSNTTQNSTEQSEKSHNIDNISSSSNIDVCNNQIKNNNTTKDLGKSVGQNMKTAITKSNQCSNNEQQISEFENDINVNDNKNDMEQSEFSFITTRRSRRQNRSAELINNNNNITLKNHELNCIPLQSILTTDNQIYNNDTSLRRITEHGTNSALKESHNIPSKKISEQQQQQQQTVVPETSKLLSPIHLNDESLNTSSKYRYLTRKRNSINNAKCNNEIIEKRIRNSYTNNNSHVSKQNENSITERNCNESNHLSNTFNGMKKMYISLPRFVPSILDESIDKNEFLNTITVNASKLQYKQNKFSNNLTLRRRTSKLSVTNSNDNKLMDTSKNNLRSSVNGSLIRQSDIQKTILSSIIDEDLSAQSDASHSHTIVQNNQMEQEQQTQCSFRITLPGGKWRKSLNTWKKNNSSFNESNRKTLLLPLSSTKSSLVSNNSLMPVVKLENHQNFKINLRNNSLQQQLSTCKANNLNNNRNSIIINNENRRITRGVTLNNNLSKALSLNKTKSITVVVEESDEEQQQEQQNQQSSVLLLEPTDDETPTLSTNLLFENSSLKRNLYISSSHTNNKKNSIEFIENSNEQSHSTNERRCAYQQQFSIPQTLFNNQTSSILSTSRRRRTSVIEGSISEESIARVLRESINFYQLKLQKRNLSTKDIVLRRCGQSEPIDFSIAYSKSILKQCRKIGEGVYGEVFMNKTRKIINNYDNGNGDGTNENNIDDNSEVSVLKIIPIEGNIEVNGEPQKKFDEILSEIVIATELSHLRNDKEYMTSGFVEVKKVRCVRGSYPEHLIDLWELYRDNFGTENDHPEIFPQEQLYIILELANGGQDLEAFTFENALQSHSAFLQTALTLAVAESKFKFEHRDLHWGNILLAPTKDKDIVFRLNGKEFKIPTYGVKVTIIDYTLSRMIFDGCCFYNDLSNEQELFSATGDYQFDIYRSMKKSLENDWERYEPYTNILWLHYVIDKMISGARYRYSKTKKHRSSIQNMMILRDELLDYKSASDYVVENLKGTHNK